MNTTLIVLGIMLFLFFLWCFVKIAGFAMDAAIAENWALLFFWCFILYLTFK